MNLEIYLHTLHTACLYLYLNTFACLKRGYRGDRCEAFPLMVFHMSEKTFALGWKDFCTGVERPLHPSGKSNIKA